MPQPKKKPEAKPKPKPKAKPAAAPAAEPEIIDVMPEPLPADPGQDVVLVSQVELVTFQQHVLGLEEEVACLDGEAASLKSTVNKLKAKVYPEIKPWYTSFGIWLALALTACSLYLVFVFYMSQTGHHVVMPAWFFQWLDLIVPR